MNIPISNYTLSEKPEVAGLWIGETLPPLAELCIRSWLDNGVDFRLFTYQDYDNVPEGTLVCDASEIIPWEEVFRHKSGSLAPFADWFRNRWLRQTGGFWTDMDMVCLKPGPMCKFPWFALQEPGLVAVGVVCFLPNHPVMEALECLSEDPATIMPWDFSNEQAIKKKFMETFPDVVERRKNSIWGAIGPEGFTRALSHFELMGKAAAPSSIYPVHYTAWRHCYDGVLHLNSPGLKNSWAIHLWGEMLRREPDAFENVRKDSIVGQLLDKHMPGHASIPLPPVKKKIPLLVGICSSVGGEERRIAIRETWMSHASPEVECFFFLGRRTPMPGEPDTVAFWLNDDHGYLPEKVLRFFRYALEYYDFDWLFKCDDDTYVDLSRLQEICDKQYDLICDMSLAERGELNGGAGYLISRELVEKIVSHSAEVPSVGAEGIIFKTLAPKLDVNVAVCECLGAAPFPYPSQDNDMISAHGCSPNHLRTIEKFYHSAPQAIYKGIHPFWADMLFFYDNGLFRRGNSGCVGEYHLDFEEKLTLKWFDWGTEVLFLENGMFRSENEETPFTLEQLPGGRPDEKLFFAKHKFIHLGCGNNWLDNWTNLDLPEIDITQPLPFQDNSIDAYFLEHVIEHISTDKAYFFFTEVQRTLKPGGILRLAFPDLLRIAEKTTKEYRDFIRESQWGDGSPGSEIRAIVVKHEHKAIWTQETMLVVLQSMGFNAYPVNIRESAYEHMRDLEHHGSQIGEIVNVLETSCVEAVKLSLVEGCA